MKQSLIALSIVTIVGTSLVSMPIATLAQSEGGGTDAQSVPISTSRNWHSIQQQFKDFTWNALAWNVAKMALQQLTTSIVNWINTGFEGSPAFLSDPEGYFLDLGDQITGNFISEFGPLQQACGPWNLDLRLAIGLGYTRSISERYTCTLGTIIGNAQNATINGYSIEGFTGGDFSQGGWPAFIALTTEPQNNVYGTYLQAKNDIDEQILRKQNSVNQDLNRGQGFLSFTKCYDTVVDAGGSQGTELGLDSRDLVQLNNTGSVNAQNGTTYKTRKDTDGRTVYQTCAVETPGSVINAGLNKALGSGIDQLNLADSINEITSALFAQLITQVITEGLGGTTKRSSGATYSYVEQLYAQSTGSSAYASSARNLESSYDPYIADVRATTDVYRQISALFTDVRNRFALAQGCYQDVRYSSSSRPASKAEAERKDQEIQNILASQVAPTELSYGSTHEQMLSIMGDIEAELERIRSISSAQDLQDRGAALQRFINTQLSIIDKAVTSAGTDYTAAQTQTAAFRAQADQYLSSCQSLR